MTLRTTPIYTDNPGALPATYVIPGTLELVVQAIVARFDGASASGSFLPCLSVYTQDGRLMARVRPDQIFAAGDTGVVTFAPFLRRQKPISAIIRTGFLPATAELALTGTPQDVPGVTTTFTSESPVAKLAVFLSARFQLTGAASAGSEYVALAVLDGVDTAHPAFWIDNGLARQGLTAFGQTAVNPLPVGTHTLKMQAFRLNGAGTNFKVLLAPTSLQYILIDT